MTKLNQIIAVEKGVKTKATRDFTEAHRQTDKTPLLSGIARTYQPRDEEGDQLPPEKTLVQVKAEEVIGKVSDALTNLFDVTLSKEKANAKATANVVVGNTTILSDVPVTYLLFLEKQLTDVHTFVKGLPTLDSAEEWEFDANTGTYVTEVTKTVKTKKIPKNWVKAEATDKHPAQVEIFHEDVIVGTWSTRKSSGALPATRVNELLSRVEALQTAVKFAREEANNTEITEAKAGKAVFDYLFAPSK
jgi:hypothetical protein